MPELCRWCEYLRSIGASPEYVADQHEWSETESTGHDGVLPPWLADRERGSDVT